MTRSVGICPVCEEKQLLRRDKTRSVYVVREHYLPSFLACLGGGKAPLPTDNQLTRQRRVLKLIEPFRAHAAVALDAWIEHRRYPDIDIDILIRVAVKTYKVRHPTAAADDALYLAQRGGSFGRSYDVYCTFCGLIVMQSMRAASSSLARLKMQDLTHIGHPVECGLMFLAHGLHGSAPTSRRLPDEFQQEQAP